MNWIKVNDQAADDAPDASRASVGMADGSAIIVDWPGENIAERVVSRPFGAIALPVLSTRRGVEGVDF